MFNLLTANVIEILIRKCSPNSTFAVHRTFLAAKRLSFSVLQEYYYLPLYIVKIVNYVIIKVPTFQV